LVTLSYTVPVRLAVSPVSERCRMERAMRARPAVDAREVAGEESITAKRIGIAANIVNRSFRELTLVRVA